jgi:sulfoxide reductase heme-binding subunit YedZ
MNDVVVWPPRPKPLSWLIPAVKAGSYLPFAVILLRAMFGALGANPIATALNQLGLLALIFVTASLACTPLHIVFGWNWPIRIRRTLGLFGFGSALAHFLVYVVLDQMLMLRALYFDLTKRPFIVVGFLALCCLAPLALTSNKASIQRLGFRRWKRLHRLAYVAGALGVLHFYLRVKADHTEPWAYAAVLGVLLFSRLGKFARDRARARRKAALAASPAQGARDLRV